MNKSTIYVRTDKHGVMRVAATRVMLDSIVVGFQHGLSAETIQQQYPALTLEEVYGAVAYYLGHRKVVDDCLEQQERVWDEMRADSMQADGAVVQRLRALRRSKVHGT